MVGRDVSTVSGDCPECGGKLLWAGMSWERHTEGWHLARRHILLKIIARRLWEEVNFRREALDLAVLWGDVLVLWRVVLPTEVVYFRTGLPGDLWDGNREIRDHILAHLAGGLRDSIETGYGVRPHPRQVKYRVFDGRG
jgi:hypothetical protein